MFRLLTLFCCAAVFTLSVAFTQEESEVTNIKATPEVLALVEESLQSLGQAEPIPRAGALCQTLGFTLLFDDKTSAKKVIETLKALAPAIEPEALRNQLYEGIAHALCDLEEYAEIAGILQRITPSADRYQCQLNIAAKIVFGHEENKTLKPFDASELIRQAIGGAVEAHDRKTEAFALAFLGQELARQGKAAESAAAFAEAIKVAQSLKEAEEQAQVMQLIIQNQVQYGQMEGAQKTAQAVADPKIKRIMTAALIQSLIQNEKYVEAEKLIKTFPADDEGRNVLIQQRIIADIKTITDEKIGELTASVSDDYRERLLQAVVRNLQQINRSEAAVQVGQRLKEPAMAEAALFIGKIDSLVEEKKFAEAIRFIDGTKEEDSIRQRVKRQVLTTQFEETHDETVIQQITETYTSEEKVSVTELREEAVQAAKNPESAKRMDLLFEVLQEQFQIMDIAGAKQTMKLLAEQTDKTTDPVQIVQYRLLLAQLQVELRDKEGVKANLGKLMQTLNVPDVKVFKGLVPEQQPESVAATGGRIKLDLPGSTSAVDESAIRNQLFFIYRGIAHLLAKADAPVESKSAFEKAKALAKLESAAVARAEKLLVLARLLAEE